MTMKMMTLINVDIIMMIGHNNDVYDNDVYDN